LNVPIAAGASAVAAPRLAKSIGWSRYARALLDFQKTL